MTAFVSANGWAWLTWLIVFNILIVVILGLRFYAARLLKRTFRLDDAFIISAYLSLLALEGPTIWGIVNGLGAHQWQLDSHQSVTQAKMLLAATWTWTIATVSCKLAVLTFYNLIFTTRRFLLVSYTMMGLCVSFLIVFISIFMTQCKPIAASWKPALGHCRPIQHQELASVSINMVLDLLIVLLPMPIIWRLQMRLSKKIELTVLFSIGLLTVGIMVWRIVSTAQAGKSPDIAYYLYFTTLQSHLEIWLGMIGATLPTLAPIKSKLIMPAISSLLASYRKSVKPIGSQQRESSVAEGVDDGVQLQRSGLNRLHEESLVEFGRYQHWVSAEGAGKDGDEENGWIGSPGVIRVGHELDVVAEPRHPV